MVLLHAFPLNGKMWEPQVEALRGTHRLITPDYPGFGYSPHPPSQPDIGYYAEQVCFLLDRLGLERVVLGGISMGGYVAFACMRLFPERVSALILANTHPSPDSGEAKEGRKAIANKVAEEGVGVLPDLQLGRLLSRENLQDEELVGWVSSMMEESSPDGVVAALGAMRERPDSTPLLEKIPVPTLVVGGEQDGLSPPEVMGAMSDRLPDSRHVVLPGAGHLSNLEAPERFNAALQEFLAEIRP